MRRPWVVAALMLAAGCSVPSGTPVGTGSPTPSTTSGTSTPGSAATPSPSATPSPTGTPTGTALSLRTTTVSGREGTLRWSVEVPQVVAGRQADTFNRRLRASAQYGIDRARRNARDDQAGDTRKLTGEAEVTTNDGRTLQVMITFVDYLQTAAHPTEDVATTVLRTSDASPVLLSEALSDETPALRTLGRAVRRIATAKGEDVTEDSGLEPRESNWAAWQTDTEGMVFVFADYQLGGLGQRTYTVPWDTVRPLLSQSGDALLAPR